MSIVHIVGPTVANAIKFGPDTGLSAAVEGYPNGAGTMVFIGRRTRGSDSMGLGNAAATAWWHPNGWQASSGQFDDDGQVGSTGPVFNPAATGTVMIAATVPATGTGRALLQQESDDRRGSRALSGRRDRRQARHDRHHQPHHVRQSWGVSAVSPAISSSPPSGAARS
jgi:hypothetical protein